MSECPDPNGEYPPSFTKQLEELINANSIENESDTPDFILASYLRNCLNSFNSATRARDNWFGTKRWNHEQEAG